MLKFVKIADQSKKSEFLIDFNPKDSAFIVSDIKTKIFLESELLKKYHYLPGSCVMRVNEFYKELFYSINNEWHLIPEAYLRELFYDFCINQNKSWIKNLKNSKNFLDFFNNFLIILIDKENLKYFEEWLDENKNLFLKNWFNLSKRFFEFLERKKVLSESGLKFILLNNLSAIDNVLFPKSKIVIDLSFSLDLCEKEIFKKLSDYKEVYILSPDLRYESFFKSKFDIYKMWEKELDKKQIFEYFSEKEVLSKNSSQNVFKIEAKTQIEEVKKATIQICKLINQGISPNDIVIYAPNLEDYWFILRSYFDKENIPFKKTVYSKFGDFKEIKYLLSVARVHLNLFSFEDLEVFYFYRESKNFINFKANYFYQPKRDLVKKFLFQEKVRDCKEKITGVAFVEWLLSFYPFYNKNTKGFNSETQDSLKNFLNIESKDLIDVLSTVFQKMSVQESLTYKSWLRFFESEIFYKELEIQAEQDEGVSSLSFNALYSVQKSYVFILGLTEESLKDYPSLFAEESEKVFEDLGFSLALHSHRQKENSLLWFLQSSHYNEVYLSYSPFNFKGDIQTQSLIYMLSDQLFSAKKIKISEVLSWDYKIKQKELSKVLSDKPREQAQSLRQAFENKNQLIVPNKKNHLSAHAIQTYRDCPFKYAGKNLFYVYETQDVERELSPLFKGSLAHSLFQKVLTDYPNLKLTKDEEDFLIEELKPPIEQIIHEKQRLLIKEYLSGILKEFLIKEKEQRSKFPNLKPVALEVDLKAFWNQEKGEISSEGSYVFKGRLDRVDQDIKTKEFVLIDYKASTSQLKHTKNWLMPKEEELQLIFYVQALEKGLVDKLSSGKVVALLYSAYGDNFSAKGFEEKNSSFSGIILNKKGVHQQEKEILNKAILASNKLTQKKVKQMEGGNFSPNPLDPKKCKKCFYKKWCRIEEQKNV
ncbi:MAG: PD-(D/E)XK nuclease family protein [Bdellovibrionaceae bacterium]|nr:PD-(D/E)XK nuclease family protein [Pseudobdellovibrionaceae bacterium]